MPNCYLLQGLAFASSSADADIQIATKTLQFLSKDLNVPVRNQLTKELIVLPGYVCSRAPDPRSLRGPPSPLSIGEDLWKVLTESRPVLKLK